MPGFSRWWRWRRPGVALAALACLSLAPAAISAGREADAVTPFSSVYILEPGQVRIGARVPVFRARGLFGKEVDLEALVQGGRPVVLAFWSKYCKACVEKFSALVAMQEKYGPQGLQVISVNTDGEYREGEATIREFLAVIEAERKIRINFPVIYDDKNWIPHALGIEFLPTIVAVDSQGRVLDYYQKFDEAGEAEILAGIEAIVQRAMATVPRGAPASPASPQP